MSLKTPLFKIPPSIFNAFEICQYQAWLMQHGLNPDQNNYFLELGRFIDKNTYKREKRSIDLAGYPAKIDIISKDKGGYLVVEVKKSSKALDSAIWQLKYYLYILRKKDLVFKAKLKIPEERKNIDIVLTENDIKEIEKKLENISNVIFNDEPPDKKRLKVCSACGHNEFCWS